MRPQETDYLKFCLLHEQHASSPWCYFVASRWPNLKVITSSPTADFLSLCGTLSKAPLTLRLAILNVMENCEENNSRIRVEKAEQFAARQRNLPLRVRVYTLFKSYVRRDTRSFITKQT